MLRRHLINVLVGSLLITVGILGWKGVIELKAFERVELSMPGVILALIGLAFLLRGFLEPIFGSPQTPRKSDTRR